MSVKLNEATGGVSTVWRNIRISSVCKGDKPAPWCDDNNHQTPNYYNHVITVSKDGKRLSFEFWASIMEPEVQTREHLLGALECFFSDASSGSESFEDFCSNFGYDNDSRNAERIWKACQRADQKAQRVFGQEYLDIYHTLSDR